jgi:hypothetical protein
MTGQAATRAAPTIPDPSRHLCLHALTAAWQRLEVTQRMTDHLLDHFALEQARALPRRDTG